MTHLNPQALTIMEKLSQAGFEVALVGGAVRDMLLGLKTTDYDFTTNATPEEILTVFPGAYYENQFGTVSLTAEKLTETISSNKSVATTPKIIDLAQATKIHSSLIIKAKQAAGAAPASLPPHPYEITTYRTGEIYDGDWRRPTQLRWGTSLEEDLARRDFTINALALRWPNSTPTSISISADSSPASSPLSSSAILADSAISADSLSSLASAPTSSSSPALLPLDLIDLFNGRSDLEAGLIRAVGDPLQRFEEDALRMMRAVRFSVQLNFAIEEKTWQAIIAQADLITHVSWERLRDEFWKMLASDYPAEAIQILANTGLLRHLLPELLTCQGVDQSGHHTTDVWVHSLDALATCPSHDPLVRLATLLHDIGKPPTCRRQDNKWTFYNHQIVGAKIANQIAHRLRLSRTDQNRLYTLVRYHMFHYQPENTDASIRRFMRQVGLENLDDILALREADRLGSGAKKTSWRLEEMKQRMIEQLHQPLDTGDLALNGYDLMQELHLQPSPILGQILNYLLEQVLDNSDLNNRQKLLELAHVFLENQALSTQNTALSEANQALSAQNTALSTQNTALSAQNNLDILD